MEWTIFGPVVGYPLIAPFAGTILWTGFWIWMLVDAVQRDESAYPGTVQNRKVLWIVAIAILHIAAVVYLLAVFAKGTRTAMAPSQTGSVPPAPTSQDVA